MADWDVIAKQRLTEDWATLRASYLPLNQADDVATRGRRAKFRWQNSAGNIRLALSIMTAP